MQPGRARTSGLGVPLLPLAWWVGWVAPVRPTHGVLVRSCPSAALRVCSVLGRLAPVHRCARAVCCVASAVSWATWLLFTGALARCVVLRVRCPGPHGSRSPVCALCAVRVCHGWLCPSSSPPNFFFLMEEKEKQGRQGCKRRRINTRNVYIRVPYRENTIQYASAGGAVDWRQTRVPPQRMRLKTNKTRDFHVSAGRRHFGCTKILTVDPRHIALK